MSEFVGQDQDNKQDNKDQAPEPDPKKARVRKLSQTQELKAITQDPRASSESRELADRKSTRLNSSHVKRSRMPSSA